MLLAKSGKVQTSHQSQAPTSSFIFTTLIQQRQCYPLKPLPSTAIVSRLSSQSEKRHLLRCVIAGPNPWKIAILFEELGVPYTMKIRSTPELKKPEFLALNRNGMAPVIEDPNTNLLLAEVKPSSLVLKFPFLQTNRLPRVKADPQYTVWRHHGLHPRAI